MMKLLLILYHVFIVLSHKHKHLKKKQHPFEHHRSRFSIVTTESTDLETTDDINTQNKKEISNIASWKNINISLPINTSHQVIGYHFDDDRVWLLGGKNNKNKYISLNLNQVYKGWNRSYKEFDDLDVIEYQQTYVTSKNNVIYFRSNQYIQIFDTKSGKLYENIIKLPTHLIGGCMTLYYDKLNEIIEYLIVIGNSNDKKLHTTYIYKLNREEYTIQFWDNGPDIIGQRSDHCCVIMDDILYVIGGIYSDTTFVQEWKIDIDTAYLANSTVDFDDFEKIFTLVDRAIADIELPHYGHRCAVNDNKHHIYVIGGITNDIDDLYMNYSKYIFVLERNGDDLYELNYYNYGEQDSNLIGSVISTLPYGIAYTSVLIDKYGYLNIFGGQLLDDMPSDIWLRYNLNYNSSNMNNTDIIWQYHKKHNHNEQWALLILLVMVILVGLWFKCVEKLAKIKQDQRIYTDTYNEITTDEPNDIDDIDDDDGSYVDSSESNDHIYGNGVLQHSDVDPDGVYNGPYLE